MAEERIKLLSITELSLELQNEGLSASAADTFVTSALWFAVHRALYKHKLSNSQQKMRLMERFFFELKEDDVKAIIKPLGIVKKIMKIQKDWSAASSDTAAVSCLLRLNNYGYKYMYLSHVCRCH